MAKARSLPNSHAAMNPIEHSNILVIFLKPKRSLMLKRFPLADSAKCTWLLLGTRVYLQTTFLVREVY
jgi:hypothetical protein